MPQPNLISLLKQGVTVLGAWHPEKGYSTDEEIEFYFEWTPSRFELSGSPIVDDAPSNRVITREEIECAAWET